MKPYKRGSRYLRVLLQLTFYFFRKSLKDQWLIASACILLIFCRISLKVAPVNRVYFLFSLFFRTQVYPYSEYIDYTSRVIFVVERCGHYLLRKRCLAQALTIHFLLNRKRIINSIRIGFTWTKTSFSGHAWVQAGEKMLTTEDKSIRVYFTLFQDQGLLI